MIRTLGFLLALALLPTGVAVAGGELRTFDLKHRTAEELIPLLRPMLPKGTALSGRNYLLIIRAPDAVLTEATELLKRLDSRPSQLMVTVQQGDHSNAARQGIGVDTRRGVHLYGAEREREGASVQRLRVLEGSWARIETGEAVPLPRRSTRVTPGGVEIREGLEYSQYGTGFEVRPRLAGDRVILSVRPFRQRRAGRDGRYETAELITTIEGALGEWIEIGGTQEKGRDSETGIIFHRAQRQASEHRTRLKVEVIQ